MHHSTGAAVNLPDMAGITRQNQIQSVYSCILKLVLLVEQFYGKNLAIVFCVYQLIKFIKKSEKIYTYSFHHISSLYNILSSNLL
jgi:hypothetical protein